MTVSLLAKRLTERIVKQDFHGLTEDLVHKFLEEAREEGRRAGIEDAATLLDEEGERVFSQQHSVRKSAASHAAMIRALLTPKAVCNECGKPATHRATKRCGEPQERGDFDGDLRCEDHACRHCAILSPKTSETDTATCGPTEPVANSKAACAPVPSPTAEAPKSGGSR